MSQIIPTAGRDRQSEKGNVLFLILIAVALFAALSYAVTQSTRSGGGDAGRETSLVNSAQITQYPASVKTAITRMIISLSVDPTTIEFNPPANFGTLTQQSYGVFHPSGGGATYTEAPSSVMASGSPGVWRFNSENDIYNIGTDGGASPTTGSADIVAFLPGVSLAICQRIHTQLGLSTTIPTETGISFDSAATFTLASNMTNAHTGIGAAGGIIGAAGGSILNGQPQGCFQQPAGTYVYFHVLVER